MFSQVKVGVNSIGYENIQFSCQASAVKLSNKHFILHCAHERNKQTEIQHYNKMQFLQYLISANCKADNKS